MFQLAKAMYFEMVEHILFLHKVELRYEYVLKGKVTNFEIKLTKNLSPGALFKRVQKSESDGQEIKKKGTVRNIIILLF